MFFFTSVGDSTEMFKQERTARDIKDAAKLLLEDTDGFTDYSIDLMLWVVAAQAVITYVTEWEILVLK